MDVTLAARPTADEPSRQADTGGSPRGIRLGIQGLTVNEAIANEMSLDAGQTGVLVAQVEPGSLADTAGLRGGDKTAAIDGQEVTVGGDIIIAVNGQAIASIQELKAALAQLPGGHPLSLTVLRNGAQVEITVQP
ncbi:MAG: PDZ domain-containing protein [Chloroflexota bacterium]